MKKKILIVDDQEVNRVLLKELLRDDFEIIEAENGEQALKILNESGDITAVLLDLIMPVLDGMGVLAELNRTGMICRLPVFIITAADSMRMLEGAYDLGAVDIIPKPFKVIFIKSRIKNIIELYQYRNSLGGSAT